jgi:hypothetical protein
MSTNGVKQTAVSRPRRWKNAFMDKLSSTSRGRTANTQRTPADLLIAAEGPDSTSASCPLPLEPYTYQPLDGESQQVRLIHLSNEGDITHYDICTVSLDDAPPYVALSYMWGVPTTTFDFIVRGTKNIRIRQNLHNFLSLYRDEGYLWIDQICIDQTNVLERNHQVALMSRIYEGAAHVIAWLALDNRSSKIRPLEERSQQDLSRELTYDILADPYFSRLWIVQEFVLARSVDIMYQDVRISVIQLGQIIDMHLAGTPQFREGSQAFDKLVHYRSRRRQPFQLLGTSKLEGCLQLFYRNHCGDPRDKVYGLMGLVEESQRLQIDYSKSTHEVYSDVIMAFISEANTHQHPKNAAERNSPGLQAYLTKTSILTKELLFQYKRTSFLLSKEMGFTTSELQALDNVIKDIWTERRAYLTSSWYLSITAMGFQTVHPYCDAKEAAKYPWRAWWYEFDGTRTWYQCDISA